MRMELGFLATPVWAAILWCSCCSGASSLRPGDFSGSNSLSNLWQKWSPRSEISPKFSIDPKKGRAGGAALKIAASDSVQFGAWQRRIDGIGSGKNYRFTAWYRAQDVRDEARSVIPRLEWLDKNGNQARPPEFMLKVAQEGEWSKIEYFTSAPTNARAAEIQLGLAFTSAGKIWWSDINLREESTPPDRVVRVATVYCRPRGTSSAAESVEEFCRVLENEFRADGTRDRVASAEARGDLQTARRTSVRPDIICLPEGITVIGTTKSYSEVSESVPGPTTDRLGRLASQLRSYIVAGVYERTGKVVYNTAVLIDRQGKLAGKYRKTHLPREEWEAGITPGDGYPVFQTDFGKVGLMLCWDVQFPEPCRAVALKGAELVLLPIWGGSEVLAKARAIENHLFLVTSSYDMKSFIVDPAGAVLGEATKEQPIASAEVHLDRQIFQPWLGNMKNRTWKERRADIPVEPSREIEQKRTKATKTQ